MDGFQQIISPFSNFMIESYRLLRRCTKPDRREFLKTAGATAVGFLVMGFIGFFVRLIHIPINNILLS
ncbi:hypothetical protein GAYE_SCF41G5463 [Galdieria yellowstonensis]|uniref:Protein transport protein Sec61 subunit gamma n=1 Tax=Galdieria yellowstonensis TaxID=3028027 RepID=A0AAV9IJK3_9RHOD|nr:hypothetical protein GAYE_SCF41G5463 [Galdieria yellowstonensis]